MDAMQIREEKKAWLANWLLRNTEITNPKLYGVSTRDAAEAIMTHFEEMEIAEFERYHEAALETMDERGEAA